MKGGRNNCSMLRIMSLMSIRIDSGGGSSTSKIVSLTVGLITFLTMTRIEILGGCTPTDILEKRWNKEQYLLDSTNFQGVSLKLKARTNTLQLERYIRSWSPTNDGLCKLCNRNEEETIDHFLFKCNALQSIRVREYKFIETDLNANGLEFFWETFIAHDIDIKLVLMLWDLFSYNFILGKIFDNSSKSILKNLWDEKRKLLNASDT